MHLRNRVVVAALTWTFAHAANGESLDNLSAIVRVEHSRSFSDISSLAFTVRTAPSVAVQIPSGSSPSQLIKQSYGFGATDSPEAYKLVESQILRLNRAADETKLTAGRVLIPDMPVLTSRISSQYPAPVPLVKNSSPIVRVTTANFKKFAYSQPIKISAPITQALNYSRLDVYRAEDAARIQVEAEELGRPATIGAEAGIALAASSGDCSAPAVSVLTEKERQSIEVAIRQRTDATERYLVILDTGWPTYKEQLQSLGQLRRILDVTRAALKLSTLAPSRFNPQVEEKAFVPTSHEHACMISRSLGEFVSLDDKKSVNVIFLPLRPGQFLSRDLFREIIELDQVLVSLGGERFSRSARPDELKLAADFAEEAMSQLPALKETWAPNDDVVRVYEPLISGLLRIIDTYASINPTIAPGFPKVDARFLISLSWNFTKFATPPSLPASSHYMIFAAAGNDQQDFVAARKLFASEAAVGRRVFAVMNSDENLGHLICNSAHFASLWSNENLDSNIASFPGRLSPSELQSCPGPGGGTSFSTPRLAWLAAASDIASRASDLNWQKTLGMRLTSSREKVEADPRAAPIRPIKLFTTK
jgi:hypothetical protein